MAAASCIALQVLAGGHPADAEVDREYPRYSQGGRRDTERAMRHAALYGWNRAADGRSSAARASCQGLVARRFAGGPVCHTLVFLQSKGAVA
jgi:hypothetical protein